MTRSVGNARTEICWAVMTLDDRFAFTINFADGTVSRFAIAANSTVTLEDEAAGLSVGGRPGQRDEGLTAHGRYLGNIEDDTASIFGRAAGEGGSLSSIGSWGGLPATVAGLAAI